MNKVSLDAKPVIWLTGASTGIGRALAFEAGRRGFKIALTARRAALLHQIKDELISSNFGVTDDSVVVAVADVTNPVEISNAHSAIQDKFGKIDILIANAGSHTPSDGKNFSVPDYKQLFDLNLFGVLNCIEAVLPQMQSRQSGHIVGVSSVAGYRALPTAAAYGASKAALTYFLDSLRFDLEPIGIAVTVVSPGFVRTPLTDKNNFPMPCMIEPSEAAREIMDGLHKRKYEVHFPRRFTFFLKFLRVIPFYFYHNLMSRLVVARIMKQ